MTAILHLVRYENEPNYDRHDTHASSIVPLKTDKVDEHYIPLIILYNTFLSFLHRSI